MHKYISIQNNIHMHYIHTMAVPACPCHRPPSCTVKGQDIGSCLGDLFSVAVWENADEAKDGETVAESVANAKRKTKSKDGNPGSTVEQFG